MKSNCLFLLIMFMLTNKVYSKENSYKEVRKGKALEPRYNFNHPPSAEYYNPIPVSIVYEDNNNNSGKSEIVVVNEEDKSFKEVREGKSVEPRYYMNHPPSVENYNPIPVAILYEDNNNYSGKFQTTTEAEVDDENVKISVNNNEKNYETEIYRKQGTSNIPGINNYNKTNVKLVAIPRTLNNFQIPVTILYESDSNNYQNHQKRKTDTSTTSTPKLRSSYNRKIEAGMNSQKEQTAQISEETENNQPITDTRVFKKRTEDRNPVVPIIEMESYVFSHNGNFHYSYEGGDGTKAYSEGKQITIDDEVGESVEGGFSYKDNEGNDFSLTYTADENGYRPVGAHLPTPPPIPPAIARALAYLATATPEPVTTRPGKSKQSVS